jgi:hypothetical protein
MNIRIAAHSEPLVVANAHELNTLGPQRRVPILLYYYQKIVEVRARYRPDGRSLDSSAKIILGNWWIQVIGPAIR